MVARLSQARFAPADVRAAKDFVDGVAAPGMLQHPGFKSMTMLSLDDGHVLVVEIYETEEQLRDTRENGLVSADGRGDRGEGPGSGTAHDLPGAVAGRRCEPT